MTEQTETVEQPKPKPQVDRPPLPFDDVLNIAEQITPLKDREGLREWILTTTQTLYRRPSVVEIALKNEVMSLQAAVRSLISLNKSGNSDAE